MITFLSKGKNPTIDSSNCLTNYQGPATPFILNEIMRGRDANTNYYLVNQNDLFDGEEFYIRLAGVNGDLSQNRIQSILSKIKSQGVPLGSICNLDQGIVSGADKVTWEIIQDYPELKLQKDDGIFVLTEQEVNDLNLSTNEINEYIKPFYKNSDIYKWIVRPKSKLFILYLKDQGKSINLSNSLKSHFEKYKQILIDKKKNCFSNKWLRNIVEPWLIRGNYFVLFYPRSREVFESIKIVNSRRSRSNIFALEESKMYEQSDIVITTLKNECKKEVSIKYLLALVNSKLYYFWLYHRGKRKGEILELFQTPLSEMPIKRISDVDQKPFITLVDRILAITKDEDYLENPAKQMKVKALEREIDRLIYQLYALTQEEIRIVEGE